jgi:DNA replication and repair protein RecF
LYGNNGSGKTNFLEAVFAIYTSKSFRNRKSFQDCVKEREDFLRIQAGLGSETIEFVYSKRENKKSFFRNEIPVGGLDFIRDRKIVYFSPEDTTNFLQNLDYRRSIVDRYISYVDDAYIPLLNRFQLLRRRRMQILFSNTRRMRDMMEMDHPEFSQLSFQISSTRKAFLEGLKERFDYFLSEKNPKLLGTELHYQIKSIPENAIEQEVLQKKSLFGCNKDEIFFRKDSRDIRHFFSNGEKKAILLAFHFAFLSLLHERNQKCLVLLDDLESEMDEIRVSNIVRVIQDFQVDAIITGRRKNPDFSYSWKVENGDITED